MNISGDFAPIILMHLNTPWEKVLSLGTKVSFPPKKVIPTVIGNTALDGMYYVTKGRMRLSHIAPNGSEKVLFHLGQGTLFNEIPMLTSASNATFTAVEQTEAYYWSRKDLGLDFIKKYPELIDNLLQSLSYKASNFHIQLCSQGLFTSFINVSAVPFTVCTSTSAKATRLSPISPSTNWPPCWAFTAAPSIKP